MSRLTSANLWGDGERGQAIILFVGIFSVILVIAAIVVDFGLWFAERRSAQRVADLAAAAGAQDLPLAPELAFSNACVWAIKNGFDAANVNVEVFERGSSGLQEGCQTVSPAAPSCGPECDTVRVTVRRSAPRLFTALLLFGIDDFDVGAIAAAGLTSGVGSIAGGGPDQTVLLIDAQGWMGNGCIPYPESCAISHARSEASNLVDTLAGSAGARVGYAPYTQCYHPDLADGYPCVSRTIVIELTSAVVDLQTAIEDTQPISGGAANLCMPLLEAQKMFEQTPNGGKRSIIFLSNGDNRYNHTTDWNNNLNYPPQACRPSPYDETSPSALGECEDMPVREELVLDRLSRDMADALKAQGVEIYVIGVWRKSPLGPLGPDPCGTDDGFTQKDAGYCAGIGNSAPDTTSNQRLLKCIASSPEHYQSVDVAGLPGTFQNIASDIVSRSLLQ